MNPRAPSLVLVIACALPGSALAQAQADDRSVQRMQAALATESRVGAATLRWADPAPRRLGVLTLLPPSAPGEIVRVRVPIGELVVTVASRVVAANRGRQAAKARREVETALAAFNARRPE